MTRDPLLKVYGHLHPAGEELERRLEAALASALRDNDDLPLLEREGDMLRISFEGSWFPEDDVLDVLRGAPLDGMAGKLDVLDMENWLLRRHELRGGSLETRSAPLNNVLAHSGH